MSEPRQYRALSLDLWFTSLSYAEDRDNQWQEDRQALLVDLLRTPRGGSYTPAEIDDALSEVRQRLSRAGQRLEMVDPERVLTQVAGALGGSLRIPANEAGRAYSEVGLDRHPPVVNPEMIRLVRGLEGWGIPSLCITNTARRGATWGAFLESNGAPRFRTIVTSCEFGRAKPDPEIFHEASRRVDVPPEQILHVGDRWELDVEGARAAGCGAVLYRGLWAAYPAGPESLPPPPFPIPDDVPVIDSLDELLEPSLWQRGRSSSP